MASVGIDHNRTSLASLPLYAVIVAICISQWIPCDSISVREGVALPQVALWFLVAIFLLITEVLGAGIGSPIQKQSLDQERRKIPAWINPYSAFIALILWMLVSTLWVTGHGNLRWAINTLWQWPVAATVYWIGLRIARRPDFTDKLVRLLIILSFTVAFHGLYQYTISMPRDRAAYRDNPEMLLAENGIDAPPGSAARMQFESRLESTEPIGPYALTNSLAGFLVTGLLLGIATLVESTRRSWRKPWNWIVLAQISCVACCLVLTRSRTAWVAAFLAILGFGILIASNIEWVWQRRKAICIGIVVILLLIVGMVAWIDPAMLAEAPMSLAFRWQYWVATWDMMLSYPWLGIGPGNFQAVYPQFKLPLASENIADPHNFLFEVGAAGGFPALGLLLLTLVLLGMRIASALIREPKVAGTNEPSIAHGESVTGEPSHPISFWKQPTAWWSLLAMLLAAILVWLIPGLIGPTPEELPYLLAISLCVVPWLQASAATEDNTSVRSSGSHRRWMFYGWMVIVAGLVHLSASGGWLAPGSTTHLFLLAGLFGNVGAKSTRQLPSEKRSIHQPNSRRAYPRKSLWVLVGGIGLLLLFLQSAWYPTVHVRSWRSQRPAVRIDLAIDAAGRAAEADPFDPAPRAALVEYRFQEIMESRRKGLATQVIEQQYRSAIEKWLQSDPRTWELRMRLGQQALQLAVFDASWLEQATLRCREAASRNPQEAWIWLQLAICEQASADPKSAREHLELAEKLDRETPHFDRRLKPAMLLWPTKFRPDVPPQPPSIQLSEPGLDPDWARGEPAAQFLRKILSTVE